MNRSRPSISVNFNIPFNGLCHGMQVMHRSGFSVTNLNAGYVSSEPQQQAKTGSVLTESAQQSAIKTSTSKSAEAKPENKAESTKKSDKKPSQRNRRQRRK
tara:strand:- start:2156 stop:2458 length:303 start_codon:yes stop_codon:yes gene_type:complete